MNSLREVLLTCISFTLFSGDWSQLVINVSSGEAEANVLRQKLSGNVTSDTVTVEFVTASGQAVTQLTDFTGQVTVTRLTVPGEQELGQAPYQVLCFVSPGTGDMIPPEAVSKLRQKHTGVTRIAEESRGRVVIDHSASLIVNKAQHLSPHISALCKEAATTTFVPDHLISQFKEGVIGMKKGEKRYNLNSHNNEQYGELTRCATIKPSVTEQCLCVIDVCVHWFPCSLKYCRNNNSNDNGEHRCGIRTCSRCTEMRFTAKSKHYCSWDEV